MHRDIRIVVVDDHTLFARGLELLLPDVSGGRASVVAATSDAASAAGLVARAVPDLVLVDLHMPPPGGIRAIAAIQRSAPRTRIVAMSGDEDPAVALEALRAGAEAFLPKSSNPAELLQPLLAVLDGWAVVPPALLADLLAPARAAKPVPVQLATDERTLLQLISGGATTTEIAVALHVSERTVKRLTATLLRKLRVTSRTEAAALAGSAGML
ncbi:response regulator transcription factor [Actinoplanes sp. TFC3]|uniref:response regulator transcription factor n=1 Tax=Actinoplanes sp. TFC3 TaxID=1710355 RepID=UPI00083546B8|nr:response regulator transcription factor [Actinoplanes sp. TFC3]